MNEPFSFPFIFKGKIRDAIILSQTKQELEYDLFLRTVKKIDTLGRMQPQKHNCIIKQINLSALHGHKFFKAWDKSFEVTDKEVLYG